MDNGSVPSRSEVTFAVTLTVLVLSFVLVVLRLVSRLCIVKRFALDDWLIVAAWLIGAGLAIAICYATFHGLGRHNEDIEVEWYKELRQAEYAFSVLYNPALMLTKASILAFYLTLSENQKIFRRLTITTLILVLVPGLALTILNIVQCRPVSAALSWNVPPDAHCIDLLTLFLSSAPVNIITDVAILFLPMPILTGMHLPRKQKTILVFVFALGGFVAIVDVIRIAYLQQATYARLESFEMGYGDGRTKEDVDFAWYASLSFMWSAVEVHVGIICACIPTIKPLVKRVIPWLIHDPRDFSFHSKQNSRVEADPAVTEKSTHSRRLKVVRHDSVRNSGLGILPSPEPQSANTSNASNPAVNEAEDGEMSFLDFIRNDSVGKTETNHEMGMLDFITTPDMNIDDIGSTEVRTPQMQSRKFGGKRSSRGSTVSHAAHSSKSVNPAFFDFVRMNGPKSAVKMTNRESLKPLLLVTVLFFLWGFAYGFLNILNSQFQIVVKLNDWESVGLHSVYFAGYLTAPPTFGLYTLRTLGFKATFIVGLCVYSCGTLIFWPSAVLTSVPAFFFSNFVVGLGVSTLEVAANPFIALCGPPEYAEIRLNLAQGVQAVGSVLSPLLAKKVLFKNVLDAPSLVDVQWAYLAIALFDVLLAVCFYYVQIPEASDDDLEEVAKQNPSHDERLFGYKLVMVTLFLGVASQFLYVGAQEVVAASFEQFTILVRPRTSDAHAFNFHIIGYAVFAAARFIGALAMFLVAPRVILLVSYVGCAVFSGLLMSITGDPGVAMIIMVTMWEASIFPIIFAMTLRGLGRHTKVGAAFLTFGAGGGAVIPIIFEAVKDRHDLRYANCITVATFTLGCIYPLYLNFYGPARRQVAPAEVEFSDGIVSPHLNRMSRTWASRSPKHERRGSALSAVLSKRRASQPSPKAGSQDSSV